jgi:toxin FitB
VTADSADRPTALVDGSVALPALSEQHEFHDVAFAAVSEHRVGIAAHALFETYAVLTRHPSLRVTPAQALAFSTALSSTGLRSAQRRPIAPSKQLAAGAISGVSTHDGVVAATAVEAGLPLLTLDRRARRI